MTVFLTSRHYGQDIYDAADASGVSHPTISQRPVAPPTLETAVFHHVITAGESIEYLAWRYFGLSDAWWRIADANPAMFPHDLPVGSVVAIPQPSAVGRVERNRSF
jgi:hypothetical protein